MNVNRFSLHGMYRNRLVRAYLGASNYEVGGQQRQPDPFTGFSLSDNLPLHTLFQNRRRSPPKRPSLLAEARPMPVINVALNLVHGEKLAWQQRKAESFSMTPLYCGNFHEGYRTPPGTAVRDGITLGTAMAISGAAANPNMGYHSSPAITFLLGLFNARLGVWLGNTNCLRRPDLCPERAALAAGPLVAELLGLTSARGPLRQPLRRGPFRESGALRDGAPSLPIHRGVRRRLRPGATFEDLGNAIRKIRIDFGIPIEFKDKIEILPNESESPDKPSRPGLYCAIADISVTAPSTAMSPMATSSTSNPPCGAIFPRRAAAGYRTTSIATPAAARNSRTSPRPISGSANPSSRVTGRSCATSSTIERDVDRRELRVIPDHCRRSHRDCPQTHRGNEAMKKLWILPAAFVVLSLLSCERKSPWCSAPSAVERRRPIRRAREQRDDRFRARSAKTALCRGDVKAQERRSLPWVDWRNYFAAGDVSSKSFFYPRDVRGVGGALGTSNMNARN